LRGNEDEAHPEVDSLDDGPEEASEDENGPESGKHPAADDDEDDDEDENHEDDDEDDDEEEDEGESEGDEGEERPPRTRRRRRRRRKKPTRQDSDSAGSRPMTSRRVTQELPRPIASALFSPPGSATANDERRIAMLCDLENIALGVRDSEIKKLEIHLILERLLEKGKIIVKKAYADWERYSNYKRPCHEAAIELIDIPQKYYSGKNSADIKMVVDAMDLCYSKEHLDTFAIVSGDSDFSPLVSKLKENNKYVIGIGVRNASSNLLIDNCDEFIFYEDVWRVAHRGPRLDHLSSKEAEVFGLMCDAMLALFRENKDVLWGSMLKQTMQRKRPSFNESTYGYGSFSELLEEAERKNIIGLKRDERSGSYVVTGFATTR
jgi:uncharacterized protein (TIGR00288 family)